MSLIYIGERLRRGNPILVSRKNGVTASRRNPIFASKHMVSTKTRNPIYLLRLLFNHILFLLFLFSLNFFDADIDLVRIYALETYIFWK
jgi:hypothetical protein